MSYNHKNIEKKWQNYWKDNNSFRTLNDDSKEKFYALDMFPFPSGSGLHVGHVEGYTATDVISRYKRMQGFDVCHPLGWDAFGLPAEQFAIKMNEHPSKFTNQNIANFKRQINDLGLSYDWDKEVSTTDPKFYKWTQWIFKQLVDGVPFNRDENNIKTLAEMKEIPVNWCEGLGTVLANEEVIDGKSERGDFPVVRMPLKQWILHIDEYADRLLEDLEDLDWPESIKAMQRNWIGKSTGATIKFKYENFDGDFEVFTTRPDTIFGVSYVVFAPELEIIKSITTDEQKTKVESYIKEIESKSDLERTELNKDKTGVFTGSYAIHPITGEKVEIWIGDYVLSSYGSGIVMAVPAHDQRDFEFATKYNLPIKKVIECEEVPFTDNGIHINSNFLNGLNNEEAKNAAIKYFEENNVGSQKTNYKLRDWLFSRQRYWGEPIPVVHFEDGTYKTLDESELPLVLPEMDEFKPSGTPESPLVNAGEWLNVVVDGKNARRETNTMPQWAGSSWYYLRYLDPHNENELISKKMADKWLPTDLYIGGAEHAVLHLLYARFWHKVLYDLGIVDTKEPFHKLFNQGMILGENNEKMSKSKGNVINPDEIVQSHGADSLRLFEMFMGPLDQAKPWSESGLDGARKFIDRVVRYFENVKIDDDQKELDFIYNTTVKKVTDDIEKLSFNTAISQLMTCLNEFKKHESVSMEQASGYIKMLSLFAPHICEELYSKYIDNSQNLTWSQWPSYDEKKMEKNNVLYIVQINGKLRHKIELDKNLGKEEILDIVKSEERIKDLTNEKEIIKEIFVPQRLVNLIVK